MRKIYFGAGCFWCSEAVFRRINGVSKVIPGYAGGSSKNPTYKEICSGDTGHAEVVEVVFDENIISLSDLLSIFFEMHDPTTLNRQGNDVGTQYRSIILYENDEDNKVAVDFINKLRERYESKIVTEVKLLDKFYAAEEYHKNYYENNKSQPYCRLVIKPKLDKISRNLIK